MKQAIKIAMIGQKGVPSTWGGVEKHVDHLSERLANFGFEIIIYARPYYVPANVARACNTASHKTKRRIVVLPTVQSKHFDTIVHTFLATVHALWLNVDIYHYHSVGPSLLSFLPRIFRPHARVVTTFHSPDRLHQKWGRVARMILTLGEWTAVTFAHQTITVSKELQQYSKKKYHARTTYIPNGVYEANPVHASAITGLFDVRAKEYILSVSRLVPHKGVHHLIRAFQKIDTEKKLVIVGDSVHTDAYVTELKKLAAGDDRILFVGFQTGKVLEELFSNCYLYVHPSESEGLSIALLEAGSYGCGVVASDIPSNKEVLGKQCWLFKNRNVTDLGSVLEQALANPTTVSVAGAELRKQIIKEYHWDKIAEQTGRVYDSLVSQDAKLPHAVHAVAKEA